MMALMLVEWEWNGKLLKKTRYEAVGKMAFYLF